jgi:hypothetical protein
MYSSGSAAIRFAVDAQGCSVTRSYGTAFGVDGEIVPLTVRPSPPQQELTERAKCRELVSPCNKRATTL